MLTHFERGLIAHLVADWLLQNHWMAVNKTSLAHPAAWVHSGIQGLCLCVALGPWAGLILGVSHLLIDTRVPLEWWLRFITKSQRSPQADHIAIWTDQVMHISLIALWVKLNPF